LLVLAASASADGVHAGLNLRVDQGAHPVRLQAGYQLRKLDATLVLDPMVATDGQLDTDALVHWRVATAGWSVLTGWRTTTIGLQGGRQFQQKLLLGVGAPLPFFGHTPLRAVWSLELAAVVRKHGGGLPGEWISFDSGRDVIDLLNFGMFVSFEYARD
jgi:hypothetical protein